MDEFGGFKSMPEGRRTHRRVSQIGPRGTRFGGVTEILNQQPGAFLTIEHAPRSQPPLPVHLKSYTGSIAASIDEFGALGEVGKVPLARTRAL
jgi:hypothetical protein